MNISHTKLKLHHDTFQLILNKMDEGDELIEEENTDFGML